MLVISDLIEKVNDPDLHPPLYSSPQIIIMKFNLKTSVVLEKVFSIEADTLKEAMDLAQKQMCESEDLNSLEITQISFDMTDPSIREYHRECCREIIKRIKSR